jgi:hypothetical protein
MLQVGDNQYMIFGHIVPVSGLNEGDIVHAGDPLGRVRAFYGPGVDWDGFHVHVAYETDGMWEFGNYHDPWSYLRHHGITLCHISVNE